MKINKVEKSYKILSVFLDSLNENIEKQIVRDGIQIYVKDELLADV